MPEEKNIRWQIGKKAWSKFRRPKWPLDFWKGPGYTFDVNLKAKIREIPNWPVKGVIFYDITTLLEDPRTLQYIINQMTQPFLEEKVDKVVAIDARGFVLATPIAFQLGAGVCLVRKKGKLPFKTVEASYQKEYGPDTLTMHKDSIKKGERVLIVDDLLATGGTIMATIEMVKKLGGIVAGISLIINLPFLGGSHKLKKYHPKWLVSYDSE